MDVYVTRRGQPFVWDSEKAASNLAKHGVSFYDACTAFFDFQLLLDDASVDGERREAAIGADADFNLLYIVHVYREPNLIRIISARYATTAERRAYENNA